MDERYGQTEIHPVALALTLAMGIAMILVRRDRAVIPLLVVACFVTHAQRIVVGGLDFSMLRVVILFGWARLLYRGEARYRYHPLDGLLLAWLTLANLAFVFGPRASVPAFVLRLGLTLDAAGIYFLFRILLRDVRDIQRSVAGLGWIAVAVAVPMVIENLTGRNLFAALGGVAEITWIRDGRLRCQGSFSHPIMAGNFGATSAALIMALVMSQPRRRVLHGIQVAAAVLVTFLSASSGPLLAMYAAVLGWLLWPYRRHMRTIRWVTFIAMVVLHFVREKPIWHLIGRLSSITGGTGWHRYRLIDEFINRFDEWWLFGTFSTSHWEIPQATDITNQYVIEGVRGGLPTLLVFVAILAIGFRTAGRSTTRAWRSKVLPRDDRRRAALLAWGLGVCLFSHAVAFIGVSYFGQLMALLYLNLAMIPSMAQAVARAESRAKGRPRERVAVATRAGGADPALVPGAGPAAGTFTTRR